MKIELEPGKYVLAVSGGVDSVVLLAILRGQPNIRLIVAHFDHGIRPDSARDAAWVKTLAERHGLPFETEQAKLGPQTSEAQARQARYEFLEKIRQKHQADAVVTAHHQDDLLETALINLLRGTGRKGMSSLASSQRIKRPLLNVRKQDLLDYATRHKLAWREDSTNAEDTYLRNYLRHHVMPKLTAAQRQQFIDQVVTAGHLNQQLDQALTDWLDRYGHDNKLNRRQFINLPHDVAREVMATWLRRNDLRGFDAKTLERLVWAAKTFEPGKQANVYKNNYLQVNKHDLALNVQER